MQSAQQGKIEAGRADAVSDAQEHRSDAGVRASRKHRICIVSDEVVGPTRNGGIGTAYTSLAGTLARAGHAVTLLYTMGRQSVTHTIDYWVAEYRDKNISLMPLPPSPSNQEGSIPHTALSLDIYEWLKKHDEFDVIHFPEWRGRAYYSLLARHQGLAFRDTAICLGMHGPEWWCRQGNEAHLNSVDELQLDFMERQCVAMADAVVSPSQFILDWIQEQGWETPRRADVIQNILAHDARHDAVAGVERMPVRELVFFGRLEQRKGLMLFCDALDRLSEEDHADLQVTFLGKAAVVEGMNGDEYVHKRAAKWPWPIRIYTEKDNAGARDYLLGEGRVAVIPSRTENSPYTVLECLGAGIPFLASAVGGIPELIAAEDVGSVCFRWHADALADQLRSVLSEGALRARPAVDFDATEKAWLDWHEHLEIKAAPEDVSLPMEELPRVSVCMTHFNRPQYLRQAITSIQVQDYPNLELVLVDDGSSQPEAVAFLDAIEPLFEERGWRIIRQKNSYLGAARNTAVRHATGEYVLFMDDDNYAKPHEVSTLIRIALRTGADILTCLSDMFEGTGAPDPVKTEVCWRYLPVGACASAGMFQNCFGDANALVRRSVFNSIGGFTEDYGIGHEDWEFFARAVLMGAKLELVPEALFWYRVTKGSMLQTTAHYKNHLRSLRPYLDIVPTDLQPALQLCMGLAYQNKLLMARIGMLENALRQPAAQPVAVGQGGARPVPKGKPAAKSSAKHTAKPVAVQTAQPVAPVVQQAVPAVAALAPAVPVAAEVQPRASAADLYQTWIQRHTPGTHEIAALSKRMEDWASLPVLHVVIDLQPGQQAHLADTIDSLAAQVLENWRLTVISDTHSPDSMFETLDILHWETVPQDTDRAAVMNGLIERIPADWVVLANAGDRLAPAFGFLLADYAHRHPGWRFIYCDEDRVDAGGVRHDPRFKPDFNQDLLRSMPYLGAGCCVRRDSLLSIGGYAKGSYARSYDAALRILDADGAQSLGHIADVLCHSADAAVPAAESDVAVEQCRQSLREHLQRNRITADVRDAVLPGSFYVDYLHAEKPLVSIIVQARDHADSLRMCLSSLLEKTDYQNYEVLLVRTDNVPDDVRAVCAEYTRDSRVRSLVSDKVSGTPALYNRAVREARGEYVLLLSDAAIVVQPNWLTRLLSQGQRPEVAVTGARLIRADQTLHHAGLILGMGAEGTVEHPFKGLRMDSPGYMGRAQVVQNLSAVSADCMLVRKSVYLDIDAMDEGRIGTLYPDVDLCLKAGERGYKVVWTPFSTLLHIGAAEASPVQDADARWQAADALLAVWRTRLARDPAFNGNLSLQERNEWRADIELDAAREHRDPLRTRILGCGLGSDGSWQYRGLSPLHALQEHGRADCVVIPKYRDHVRVPTIAELERIQPDTLLFYNALHDVHLGALDRYRKHSSALRVFSLDDLATDLPQKNPFRATIYKDIKKRIRTAVSACDRLIVTTAPLGEAFRDMIDDIVIVPNYLERSRWGVVQPRRGQGKKPRVGWAGALQHQGDLELISSVIKETAQEFEWVFFGMCPKDIRPYVAEFHAPVSFDLYPDKLASLDLDIAVAPLEHNKFNEAKSNLRLLEYGIMGWPVICTNIHPYQDAPVARVPNNPRAWMNALRERAADLEAAAAEGDRLRQWVLSNWMLDDHLDDWLSAFARSR